MRAALVIGVPGIGLDVTSRRERLASRYRDLLLTGVWRHLWLAGDGRAGQTAPVAMSVERRWCSQASGWAVGVSGGIAAGGGALSSIPVGYLLWSIGVFWRLFQRLGVETMVWARSLLLGVADW
jgi:hypothetical protein